MAEPAKPFACSMPDCGMSFTNEDHLHVHTKKHDMVLQLGLEQKAAFVADQTPTPTRFIRNCEEVGLFQDLQNVAANPFDEGFKRAMESKVGILSLDSAMGHPDDVLHTPQMVFPLLETADNALFNSQRNITISRSSSDESGTIKGFETKTISKLTNEVTTISRIVNSDDVTIKHTDIQKDVETVSFKNNVIRIESNVIRKDVDDSKVPVPVYSDSVIKETVKDNLVDNSKLVPEKLPIMSQKSLDFVVDSLTSELETNVTHDSNEKTKNEEFVDVEKIADFKMMKIKNVVLKKNRVVPKTNAKPKILLPKWRPKKAVDIASKSEDYEVVIKFPNGKRVKMKPVEEPDPKEVIRDRITKKNTKQVDKPIPNIVKIPTGTLIPVTLVNQEGTPLTSNDLNKVPITKINNVTDIANLNLPVPLVKETKPNANTILQIQKKIVPITPETHLKISDPYHVEDPKVAEKRKADRDICLTEEDVFNKLKEKSENDVDDDDDCVVVEDARSSPDSGKRQRIELERKSAASKRYRERLKDAMQKQSEENRRLREANQRLIAEKAVLKLLITEHMKRCPNAGDIARRLSLLTNGGSV